MASGVSLEEDALFQLEEISKQEGGYISEDEIQNLFKFEEFKFLDGNFVRLFV